MPNTKQVDRRRRAPDPAVLLEVAASLFDRYGYHAVTMEQLAEELHISKPTLYNHVDSKSAIVASIVDHWIDKCDEVLVRAERAPNAIEWLRIVLTGWTLVAIEQPAFSRFFEHAIREASEESAVRYRSWSSEIHIAVRKVIERGQAAHELRGDLDPAIMSLWLIGSVAWAAQWYRPAGHIQPDVLIDQQWSLFRRSVGA